MSDQGKWIGGVPNRRDFLLLLLSNGISSFGTALSMVALPVLVYGETGSAALTGALSLALSGPYLVLAPIAGYVGDRRSRKAVMVVGDAINGAAFAAIVAALFVGIDSILLILSLAVIGGSAYVFFDAAAFGAVFSVVGRDGIAQANRHVWGLRTLSQVAGPPVAGVLIAAYGPALPILLDAGSYALSAVALLAIRVSMGPAVDEAEAGPTQRQLLVRLFRGFRIVLTREPIRSVVTSGAGQALASGALVGLLVVYADERLGIDTSGTTMGVLYGAVGVGSVAGSVWLPKLAETIGDIRLYRLLQPAMLVSLLLLLAVGHWALSAALLIVFQAAASALVVVAISLRQRIVPDALQSQVNTAGRTIAYGGVPIGAGIGGTLSEALGILPGLAIMGSGIAVGIAIIGLGPLSRAHDSRAFGVIEADQ